MTTETEWRPSMPGREPGGIAACVIGVDLIRETLKRYDPPPIDPSDEEIMAAARKVIDAYFDIDGSYTDFQSTVLFRTIDVLRGAFTADQLAEMLQTEEGRRSIDERDTFALGGQPLVDETRAVNQFTRDFRQALGSEGSLMTLAVRIASIAGQVPIPIGSTQTVRSMLGEGDQDRFSHDEIIEALMHIAIAFQQAGPKMNPHRQLLSMTATWAAEILTGEKTIRQVRKELGSRGRPRSRR